MPIGALSWPPPLVRRPPEQMHFAFKAFCFGDLALRAVMATAIVTHLHNIDSFSAACCNTLASRMPAGALWWPPPSVCNLSLPQTFGTSHLDNRLFGRSFAFIVQSCVHNQLESIMFHIGHVNHRVSIRLQGHDTCAGAPAVLPLGRNPATLEQLRECNGLLDEVQKGLAAYLEKKRLFFPRCVPSSVLNLFASSRLHAVQTSH